ncbi:MAG: glycosyltransferase family 2 protein [Patescibacteria group bacterium]|nr:glycosyltransferase family 2 protein [Patescibacteria group bacterium]
MISKLSLFFPVYNEGSTLREVVGRAVEVLNRNFSEWEIIIVNDGSSDVTAEEANRLSAADGRIRVINHKFNRGYGAALASGFYNARFDWIVFTDADGQFDFSEITEFVQTQARENADMVVGYYRKRAVPLYRKLNSFLWELLVFVLFGLKVRDIDCGFKLISRKVIERIPHLESERGAFVSTEFLVKSQRSGFKIVEVPVSHYPRRKGIGTGASPNVILGSFYDLFKLWRKMV